MKNKFWALIAVPLCVAGCVNPVVNSARNTRALPAYSAPTPPQNPVVPRKDPDAYRESDSGRSYSLTLKNADLRDVLILLSKESGVSIVAERGLQGTVQVDARNKKLGEILYTVLKPLGYTASVENGMILVGRPKLTTRTFRVNYLKDTRNSSSNTNVSGFVAGGSGSVNVSTTGKSDFWGALEVSLEMFVFGSSGMGKRDSGGYIRGESEKKVVLDSAVTGTQQTSGKYQREQTPVRGAAKTARTGVSETSSYDESSRLSVQTTEAEDPMVLQTQLAENKLKQLVVNEIAGIVQITDYPENLDKIASFLADVEEGSKRQVMIQAHIMEVGLKDSFSLGLDWQEVFKTAGSTISIGQALSPATNVFKIGAESISSRSNLNILLDAMKEQGNLNMLSSPKISALNNQKAVIKLTTKQVSWVSTKTTSTGYNTTDTYTSAPQIDEVGIFLDVTPQIGQDNSITMQIHPSVSEIKEMSTSPKGESTKPVIDVREIDTMVDARAGETIVIAGLISDKLNETKKSVPLLGDIPYLGALFSYNKQERAKTELVIMMTPYILNAKSIEEIRKEHELRLQNIGGSFHLINNMGGMVTEKSSRDWMMKNEPDRAKPPEGTEGGHQAPPAKPADGKPHANVKPAGAAVLKPESLPVFGPGETATPVTAPPAQVKAEARIPEATEKPLSPEPVADATADTKTARLPKAAAPEKKASTTPTLEGIASGETGIRLDISGMKEKPVVLRETKNRRIIIKMPGVRSAIGDAEIHLASLGFQRAKIARHTEGIWVVLHSGAEEMQRIAPRLDEHGLILEAAPPLPLPPPAEQVKSIKKPAPPPAPHVAPPAATRKEKTSVQPVAHKAATTDTPPAGSAPPKEKSAAPQQVAVSATATNEQTLYRAGVTAYKLGNCAEAVKFLNSFLKSYPQSPFVQDATVYRSDCQERGRITALNEPDKK